MASLVSLQQSDVRHALHCLLTGAGHTVCIGEAVYKQQASSGTTSRQQCFHSWPPAGMPATEDAHLAPGPSVLLAAALRQASGRQSGAHPPCSPLETYRTAAVLQLTEPVIAARVLFQCSRHAVSSSLTGLGDGAMLNDACELRIPQVAARLRVGAAAAPWSLPRTSAASRCWTGRQHRQGFHT